MAKDLMLKYDYVNNRYDIKFNHSDYERDEGLYTSVILSLFCNAYVTDDELETLSQRVNSGFWGDQISQYEGDIYGSKLWLLERAKLTSDIIETTKIYIYESLEWMITDGVAEDIVVNVELVDKKVYAEIMIIKGNNKTEKFKFQDLWDFTLGCEYGIY